jgi:hypothetical protein
MSLIGELLFKSTTAVYTGMTSRGGYAGEFYVDVLQLESSATVDIDIEHKNFNEDTWATAASFTQISTATRHQKAASDLRQEVRLKVTVSGSAGAWVRVLFLPPVWKDS